MRNVREILVPHRDSSQKEGIKKREKKKHASCGAIHGFDDDEVGIKASFRGTFVGGRLMKILNGFSRISCEFSRIPIIAW